VDAKFSQECRDSNISLHPWHSFIYQLLYHYYRAIRITRDWIITKLTAARTLNISLIADKTMGNNEYDNGQRGTFVKVTLRIFKFQIKLLNLWKSSIRFYREL
jgi:hypothetical protein